MVFTEEDLQRLYLFEDNFNEQLTRYDEDEHINPLDKLRELKDLFIESIKLNKTSTTQVIHSILVDYMSREFILQIINSTDFGDINSRTRNYLANLVEIGDEIPDSSDEYEYTSSRFEQAESAMNDIIEEIIRSNENDSDISIEGEINSFFEETKYVEEEDRIKYLKLLFEVLIPSESLHNIKLFINKLSNNDAKKILIDPRELDLPREPSEENVNYILLRKKYLKVKKEKVLQLFDENKEEFSAALDSIFVKYHNLPGEAYIEKYKLLLIKLCDKRDSHWAVKLFINNLYEFKEELSDVISPAFVFEEISESDDDVKNLIISTLVQENETGSNIDIEEDIDDYEVDEEIEEVIEDPNVNNDEETTEQLNVQKSCNNTESLVMGDELKNVNNITIFVTERSKLKGECLLTSEWKAHLDRFTGQEALTFYPPHLNNNAEKQVFKLPSTGTWITSSKELLLMFNTFYLKSIGMHGIGSYFGVSRLHGAEEEIFIPIPIHREDFNKGEYTVNENEIVATEQDLTKSNREEYSGDLFTLSDNGQFLISSVPSEED